MRGRPSLAHLLGQAEDDAPPRPKLAPDIEAIRLRDALVALNDRAPLRVGMIVRQKPQVPHYSSFGDNGYAIVVELLSEPIIGDGKLGTPYFRDPMDMIIGSIENGTDFCLFHVDSRRFEPVPEDDLALRLTTIAAPDGGVG